MWWFCILQSSRCARRGRLAWALCSALARPSVGRTQSSHVEGNRPPSVVAPQSSSKLDGESSVLSLSTRLSEHQTLATCRYNASQPASQRVSGHFSLVFCLCLCFRSVLGKRGPVHSAACGSSRVRRGGERRGTPLVPSRLHPPCLPPCAATTKKVRASPPSPSPSPRTRFAAFQWSGRRHLILVQAPAHGEEAREHLREQHGRETRGPPRLQDTPRA